MLSSKEEAIKRWKDLKLENAVFNFSCGGDSMGQTEVCLYSENEQIKDTFLEEFFDTEVYNYVEFYEISDGHYLGESGDVHITLNEYDEVAEFEYSKTSTSEYSEMVANTVEIELTEEEKEFFSNYIANIDGDSYGDSATDGMVINYLKDFLLTEEKQNILDSIVEKVTLAPDIVEFDFDGEREDYYTYTTNSLTDEGKLLVSVSAEFLYEREDGYM